jgi:hypothetical protein
LRPCLHPLPQILLADYLDYMTTRCSQLHFKNEISGLLKAVDYLKEVDGTECPLKVCM